MAHEFELRRRVDFHETDMAGIVHFSNFFRLMESTEHEFFRSLELKSARTAHVTGSLFDAAAILLPTVFVETAKTPGRPGSW